MFVLNSDHRVAQSESISYFFYGLIQKNRFVECRLRFCLEDAQMLLLFKATVIKDERQKSEKRDLFFF